MDLSKLPSEIIWTVLEHLTNLAEKKNASLVCRSWNQMLFSSPKAQQNLKLRICGWNRSRAKADQQFRELINVMIASNRNYVNIEFCNVHFDEVPIAADFLRFIVTACSKSLRCLKFESCGGLFRSVLLAVLRTAPNLEELHVINRIGCDGIEVEPFALPTLRSISLYISDNCQLYDDVCWLAPGLQELSIRTRDGFTRTRRYMTTVQRFSAQLRKLEYTTQTASNVTVFQLLQFQNLIDMELNVPGSVDSSFIRSLKNLENLTLKGNVCDEVVHAACDIPRLRSLSLQCSGLYECYKFSQLAKLGQLETLYLTGIYNHSWKNISLPSLSKLHVQSVGIDFPELLKHSSLKSLEIHDVHLSNKQLNQLCHVAPTTLERLELAKCSKITDAGLKNVPRLTSLRDLRLWEVGVSSGLFQRWRTLPQLKQFLIYFNNRIDDAIVEDIATKATNLHQVVFYDCYNISEEAVQELRKRLPSCEVLRIYRGGPLPASLVHETQIYRRSVDHPNGVLKTELPFSWDTL